MTPVLVSPVGLLSRRPDEVCLVVLPPSRSLDEDFDEGEVEVVGATFADPPEATGTVLDEMEAVRKSMQPHTAQMLVRTSGGVLRVERGRPRAARAPPNQSESESAPPPPTRSWGRCPQNPRMRRYSSFCSRPMRRRSASSSRRRWSPDNLASLRCRYLPDKGGGPGL